jgi:putative transposase
MPMAQDRVHAGSKSSQALFIDEGALRASVQALVRSVLEEEVARHLGAQPYERTEARRGSRNGNKPRTMKTCVGELRFAVPQVREGGFRTQVFERYQRSDRALVVAIQEMYVKGVSTRKVGDVLEAMGGFELSAATVSRAAAELDDQVGQWRTRSLADKLYPFLIVDARYERMRNSRGQVVSQAVLVICAITHQGKREALGMWVGDSESESTWGDAFADLKGRGLAGVKLVVSDAHLGIKAAVARHFQGALWQRCKVHWLREALKKCHRREQKELMKGLRLIFAPAERSQCMAVAKEVAAQWETKNRKLSQWILETVEQCLAVWHLPQNMRQRLNSTNMLERLMRELKRRSRVVSIFPNEASLVRLLGSVLVEVHEQWGGEAAAYIDMAAHQAVEMTS